ncbi:MAG TPA: glycosyltransferase [Patescibacteria group bacterium]|nr:glycosyltransferase [Patescibacteria group bacterium]
MRLAYVVSLFPKLSETFILRELIELTRRGHEVTIFSLKTDRESLEQDEARELSGRTVYPRFGWEMVGAFLHYFLYRPLRLAGILWRVVFAHIGHPTILIRCLALIPETLWFARVARARGIQHVHAHWATYPALSAWIISKLDDMPYSVTGHAHDLLVPNPMLKLKVADSRFFATISEFNRALLIQKCGPGALEKVRLIRCGLPMASFPFNPRRAASESPTLVSVGRLVDYKGFDVLIRACGHLRDSGRPLRCRIVGEGPERARLDALITKLQLEGLVTLEGGKLQKEVTSLIASADLFVLACVPGDGGLQDGIPIVLMEAMALGVPVISTKLSGIPELVVDHRTGLLVAPGDDGHLAAAIERLLAEPSLAEELRVRGREMIEKEFDVAHSVEQLCTEFRRGQP